MHTSPSFFPAKLIPTKTVTCLDQDTQYAVCIGAEAPFTAVFEAAVITCSMEHFDEFGSIESAMSKDDSASCEFNDYFQHVRDNISLCSSRARVENVQMLSCTRCSR